MSRFFLLTALLAALSTFSFSASAKTETATLAAGCFWGVEEFYRKMPGVIETRVGYAGGKMPNPKYDQVSEGTTGHAETVEIKYDPAKITYEKILEQFFKMHDPTTKNRQGNDVGTQYRSAIFTNSKEQKDVAEKFRAKVEASKAWKAPISTEITPATNFYPAESEHQKYLVKNPGGYDNHFLRPLDFNK
jgi:methionine-S-sulfoxide reductase